MNPSTPNKLLIPAVIVIVALILVGGIYWINYSRTVNQPANEVQNVVTNPATPDNYSTSTSTDSNEPAPVITSITPSSGPVGTVIELKGTDLRGFEGDENVWIQNSAGQKGIIHTDSSVNSATDIKFTLANSYCTADVSYSGAPCPSNLSITPGSYSLSVDPWGTPSNAVKFTVTATSTSQTINSQPSIKVLSPNGGESLIIGQSYQIKWIPNSTKVNILLNTYDQNGNQIGLSVKW